MQRACDLHQFPIPNDLACEACPLLDDDWKTSYCPHARMRYMCVPYVHNPGVHGRFYGLDLKKEMVALENKQWGSLNRFDDEKYSRFEVQSSGRTLGYTRDLLSQ